MTYLKIKDGVDLKELEKFGFRYLKDGPYFPDSWSYIGLSSSYDFDFCVGVNNKTRSIYIRCLENANIGLFLFKVFQLFQTGWVEEF